MKASAVTKKVTAVSYIKLHSNQLILVEEEIQKDAV